MATSRLAGVSTPSAAAADSHWALSHRGLRRVGASRRELLPLPGDPRMTEAEEVFAEQATRWRANSWEDLRRLLDESPVAYELQGSSGIAYQFEALILWTTPGRRRTSASSSRATTARGGGSRTAACGTTRSSSPRTARSSAGEAYRRSAEIASASVTICLR